MTTLSCADINMYVSTGQEESNFLNEGSFVRMSPTGNNSVRVRRDSAVESLTLARQAVLNSNRREQSPLSRVGHTTALLQFLYSHMEHTPCFVTPF